MSRLYIRTASVTDRIAKEDNVKRSRLGLSPNSMNTNGGQTAIGGEHISNVILNLAICLGHRSCWDRDGIGHYGEG